VYFIVLIHMQTLITAVVWITASQIYILMLIIQLIDVYTPVHRNLIIMQIIMYVFIIVQLQTILQILILARVWQDAQIYLLTIVMEILQLVDVYKSALLIILQMIQQINVYLFVLLILLDIMEQENVCPLVRQINRYMQILILICALIHALIILLEVK
jgi:hypothetical protein